MKSHINKIIFLSLTVLFIVPTSVSAAPLQANGFNTSACNTQVSNSTSITEDRSFYISDGWMGGMADADDQIGYSAMVNSSVVVDRSYPWSVGCGDTGASSGWDGINTFLGGNTDNDTILFKITAIQKRDEEINYFWGRIHYDYTRNNCAGCQMTLNNFCQWISGSITATHNGTTVTSGQTITCTAPCSPTINWATTIGMGSRVEKNNSTWQTSPTGSSIDSNLSPGTYTYALFIKDGYNNEYGCCAVAVQVNSVPVAEMSGSLLPASTSCEIAANNNNCTVSLTWSVTNPQNTNSLISAPHSPYAAAISQTVSNSGTGPFTAPAGHRTFTLSNNGVPLATSQSVTTCVSGTTWNGSD